MELPRVHCWHCAAIPSKRPVYCSQCPMAVYCSALCLEKDTVDRERMMCKSVGPTCNTCQGTFSGIDGHNCSRCNAAWYCNKACQRRDWQTHKPSCNKIKASIKSLTMSPSERNIRNVNHPPYYLGNTRATDFLQLGNNEWSESGRAEQELTRDYHILSAGCGNLRSTVLTAVSLPDRYRGKLHVTLNDFDPFVMARNVLFLFMLVRFADTDYIASSLTTIWYSLHLPTREYDLIKTSLDELIQMTAQQLHDATNGLLRVLDEDLGYLCQVWEGWRSLKCQRDKSTSINLRKQRKTTIKAEHLLETLHFQMDGQHREDIKRMTEWMDNGIFVPSEKHRQNLPFDNPTLTGREECLYASDFEKKAPKDYPFVYCLDPADCPYTEWDYLQVTDHNAGSSSSSLVMYHNYITSLLLQVKGLIHQERFHIHISLANCLAFPEHHLSQQMTSYDRIFTSNLADCVGFAAILQTFKPLLNTSNNFSVIVTETMQWVKCQVLPATDTDNIKLAESLFLDKQATYTYMRKFHESTSHFLQFLRADIMKGGASTRALKRVPPFKRVRKYHDMEMRDFRKGLNKLVPFVDHFIGAEHPGGRAVEWCLPRK